ncbi:facilitated trehalose transporter Tret1-like isoform X2 [Leptopilina boulardi]|uniref:facilitated trehalose transporter Tret1-like isoform X2 n=1 Tax=Leptopilina boulardi TaxID=63433 RepID=UPI0021F662D1|nr:facilitated trehalose transporter Tret1-like isoform X2 [Leptopilina boulardi]
MLRGIENILTKHTKLPYWIAAIEVGLLSLGIGLISGWTSPYVAQLSQEGLPFSASLDECSWIVSLLSLGRIFGAILGAIGVATLGSKKTAFLAGIPQLIGWLLLTVAKSVSWIYLSRFLSGISFGFFFVCFPLYVGEVSDPKIRGALVAFIMNCQPIGTLIGNTMGAYLPMWQSAVISMLPTLIFLGSFFLLPESPHYLAKKGNYDEAKNSIKWYHRKVDPILELEDIKQFVNTKIPLSFKYIIDEFSKPKNRKALIIANLLFAFMQISGLYTITFYMEVILREAQVNIMEPKTIVIMVNCIGIVAGWFGMYAIDKCGRRILLGVSSGGICLSLIILSVDCALIHYGFEPKSIQWLPIISLFIFQSFICIGIISVPCTIISEIFSPDIKGYASSITSVTSGIFSFISSKTYQDFLNVVPAEYVYGFYALTMFLQVTYCFFIPETKDGTF